VLVVAALAALPAAALGGEPVRLTLKNNRFEPAEVTVAAGERFRIEVTNQDTAPAEFESSDLKVEKIVVPGATVGVMAGPLKPGRYAFFDDYHPDLAKGTLVAAEKKD
jgi:plastocyanin